MRFQWSYFRGLSAARNPFFRKACLWLFLLLVLVVPTIGIFTLVSGETNSMPSDYGKVLFQYNQESPNQLYIVGISHRDTLTRSPNLQTAQVESEIYKIGEWLIRNRKVELLLPEGFFREAPEGLAAGGGVQSHSEPAPDRTVSENPEALLKANFPVVMRQVEDKDLYESVYRGVQELAGCSDNPGERFPILCELDYQQKMRVAAMLQKIPKVINKEFALAQIHAKKAVFTIGLSHIPSIIQYISEKKIAVPSPLYTSIKHEDYVRDLDLTKEDFGVTVIVPATLARDREILKRNGFTDQ